MGCVEMLPGRRKWDQPGRCAGRATVRDRWAAAAAVSTRQQHQAVHGSSIRQYMAAAAGSTRQQHQAACRTAQGSSTWQSKAAAAAAAAAVSTWQQWHKGSQHCQGEVQAHHQQGQTQQGWQPDFSGASSSLMAADAPDTALSVLKQILQNWEADCWLVYPRGRGGAPRHSISQQHKQQQLVLLCCG